jgi:hypothetical protein
MKVEILQWLQDALIRHAEKMLTRREGVDWATASTRLPSYGDVTFALEYGAYDTEGHRKTDLELHDVLTDYIKNGGGA